MVQHIVRIVLFTEALMLVSSAVKDGITITLPQTLLQKNGEQISQGLVTALPGTQFPDFDGEADLSIGYLFYHLRHMKVLSFGAPQTDIRIIPSVGVKAALYGASMSVCGNWSYDTLLGLGGEGHFVVDITGIDLTLTLTIDSDNAGTPIPSVVNCSCTVQEVLVDTHQWFTNMFSDQISDGITQALNTELCNGTSIAIGDLKNMTTQYLPLELLPNWFLDLSLATPPVFSYGYIELTTRGEVFVAPHCAKPETSKTET